MRHSTSSATRVLTIFSLVILCSLSFSAVNAQDLDTPSHKRNVHYRRAIHHLRASTDTPSVTPTPTPTPTPSSTQSPSVGTTSTSSTDTSVSSSTSSTPTSSSTDSSTSPVQSTSTSTSQPPDSTTSTTSSTSSQTSDNPSSTTPSSSRTTSSPSSNTSPTTSATPAKSNSPIGGSTTPHPSNSLVSSSGYILATISGSTVYASPTVGATSSKGFFANKAAVGATFGIIGIIGGLAVVIGAITMIKRYRRSRDDEDDFYEKYPGAPASATNQSHFSRELGQGPLGASATDLSIDAAPPEAYPDRAIHYGQPDPSTVFRPVDYGIDYPPNAAADTTNAGPGPAAAADPGENDIAYEYYEYDPNRRSTSAGSHPFADPANAPRTAPAPPVSYPRQVQGRAQEMVTVDSYYGPNTAGVGASGVGYAQ